MNMETANYTEFAKDINEALKAVGEKYDIDLSVKGNFTYERGPVDSVRFKIQGMNRTENGDSVDPYLAKLEKDFANYAYRYNMEGFLGASFTHHGAVYKVIGMKPRSKKQPIIVEKADGGKFKFPAGWVQDALEIERTPVDREGHGNQTALAERDENRRLHPGRPEAVRQEARRPDRA